MAETRSSRSLLATAIGYIIVAIIVWILVRSLIGTIVWIVRTLLILVLIGGLITLYFKLKTPKD